MQRTPCQDDRAGLYCEAGLRSNKDRDSPPDCKQKPLVFAPHLHQEAVPAVSAGTAETSTSYLLKPTSSCMMTTEILKG